MKLLVILDGKLNLSLANKLVQGKPQLSLMEHWHQTEIVQSALCAIVKLTKVTLAKLKLCLYVYQLQVLSLSSGKDDHHCSNSN